MKVKIFVIGIFILTIADYAFPQQKRKLAVAPRAGLNFTSFKINGLPEDFTNLKGDDNIYAGLQLGIPIGKKLSLLVEGTYALSAVSAYDTRFGQLYTDELSHIFVPLLLKFSTGQFGFYAGPQMQFLTSAKGQIQDIKAFSYNEFGISGLVGIEFMFRFGLGIEARYQYGLTDNRAENGQTFLTEYGKIQMNAFQTGLFFRIGGNSNH